MSSDSDSDNDATGYDDWNDPESEDTQCRSLFDTTNEVKLDSPAALLEHDLREYGFDVRSICGVVGTNDITLIKLVNFVRGRVVQATRDGIAVDPTFAAALQSELCNSSGGNVLGNDNLMIPVDREDPLLYLLAEAIQADGSNDSDDDDEESSPQQLGAESQVKNLQNELAKCKLLLKELTKDTLAPSGNGSSASVNNKKKADAGAGGKEEAPKEHEDGYYFDGYGHLSIHEVMLRDRPRTTTYQASLIENKAFLKDKVVLDVGCGTGILSMFAAQAGAKKVIGVDSSNIIESAKRIVRDNGFADKITLVRGRLEEVDLPLEDGEQVDVIVSEWMGYALYFENMLTSVMFARDKWLNKETGIVMPHSATIYIEAMASEGGDDRVGYWRDVYGFSMALLDEGIVKEAQVQYAEAKHVVSSRYLAHELDISVATNADLDFVADFELVITKDTTVNSFVLSFDVLFTGKQAGGGSVAGFQDFTLSTACEADPTHWKQTVLWLKPEYCMKCAAGEAVKGQIHYQRSVDNPRDYVLVLTWNFRGQDNAQSFNLMA
jgi:SAM-dependent methyltransferase